MSGILVIAEHRQGELREVTLEVLRAALGLGEAVVTAMLADDPGARSKELLGRTPELHLLSHPGLAAFDPELYLAVLEDLCATAKPSLVLMGHTSQGMDLAPALAGRLGCPLVTDCTDLGLSDGILSIERRIYAGKVSQRLTMKSAETIVCTVQPGAYDAADMGAETEVRETSLGELSPRHARRFVEYLTAAAADVDITAAEILVSVGRGIGNSDNIGQAQALADAVGGTLACSRPVADAEWLPKSRQVGTSGKAVRPKVYIALGISGAFQHVAGMKGAGTIIAVNKDPRAPIFQVAHYGIVADLFEVLPKLTEKLR